VLSIDGSFGEGGGQIVRTAVALSVLTNTPISITNIRANRPVPGLRPQHYTAVSCVQSMCQAKTEGLSVGSSALTFIPGSISPGSYNFDVGTAGSITLVFQTCLLSALRTTTPITIRLKGGTDVRWAPSWDYFARVFLPLIRKIGIKTEVQLHARGYYPAGGGDATMTIYPFEELHPFQVIDPQSFSEMRGIINIANLPDHIGTRMKHAAMKIALRHHLQAFLQVEPSSSASPGTGIVVWSETEETVLGANVLGEKGMSAEQVGENAATQLCQDIMSGATVDRYAIDQLLPYLVYAPKGSACLVRELSTHANTHMWLLKQFFPVAFELAQLQHMMRITVR
jgi:RNA 3'-terminal phosphate cyclase (GTP)